VGKKTQSYKIPPHPPLRKGGEGIFPPMRGKPESSAMAEKEVHKRRSRGFTLLEVLLAILILGVVVSTVYAAFTGTYRIARDTGYEGELYGMARSVLDRMARDLASLTPYGGDYNFIAEPFEIGEERFTRLSFRSRGHISFQENDLPGVVAVIAYEVKQGTEESGYVLMRSDTLDYVKDEGEEKIGSFPLCEGIKALSFTFTGRDGKEYNTWDSRLEKQGPRGQIPASVLVVLELVNPRDVEHPFRFMTRIFLPASQGAS
jgi:prepilin-type N-terminal cleavage/methylation domain-containing protein